ncbi:hypothetical protein [Streptomyces bacillaris]|uniref:hypothetical protein n=1 Tax=Streptomyces bacillaris TaxID=68179 RepID=UPI003460A71B
MSRNYDIDEAAEYLRCKRYFLEEHLKELPHQRMGRSISFDEIDLEAIKDMHRVKPCRASQAVESTPLALASIQPSKRRQKTG